MKGLNLAGFDKIKEEKDKVHMKNKDGHIIVLAVKALPKIQREQLKRLPMKDGGEVQRFDRGTPAPISPDAAKSVQTSFRGAVHEPDNSGPSLWDKAKALVTPSSDEPSAEASQNQAKGGEIQHYDVGTTDAEPSAEPSAAPSPGPTAPSALTSTPAPAATQDQNMANAYAQRANALNETQQMNLSNRAMIDKAHEGFDKFNASPDSQIDADKYRKNMSLGDKVSTGIGLFLGGFSVPFGGQNFASDFLNKQIQNNIDAQKENYQHQKNVWGAAHELFNDNNVADNFAKVTSLDQVNNMIKNSALSIGTPQAGQRATALINQNNIQKEQLKNHSAQILTNKQQSQQQPPPQAVTQPPMSFLDKVGQYLPTGGTASAEQGTMPPNNSAPQSGQGKTGLDTTVPDTGPLPQFHIDEKGINNSQYLGAQDNPPPNEITPGEVGSVNSEIGKAKQFNEKIPLIHQNFAEMWKNRSDSNAALKYISSLGVNLEGIHLQPPDMTSWNENSKNYYRAANRVRQELGALVGNGALTHEQAQTVMTNLIKEGDTPEDYKNILKQVDGNLLSTLQTPVLDKYKKIKRPKIRD